MSKLASFAFTAVVVWAALIGSTSQLQAVPIVTDVSISGTGWVNPPFSLFAHDPSSPLPWINANTITATFDQGVDVSLGSLALNGVSDSVTNPDPGIIFTYNSATFEASWALPTPLGIDHFVLNIAGELSDGFAAVRAAGGGDLLNGGSDFERRFSILPGDTNQDGMVDNSDVPDLAAPFSIFNDVDGDGDVEVLDQVAVVAREGTALPSSVPEPATLFLLGTGLVGLLGYGRRKEG